MPECSELVHLGHEVDRDYCGQCGKAVVWWCDWWCDVQAKAYASSGLIPGGAYHRNSLWAQFCTTCGKPKP